MNEFSIFGTQFTASAVIALIGHVLERWFPTLGNLPTRLKRIGYWLVAAGSAVGVHAHYSAQAGTLLFTGLGLTSILTGAWHWVQSIALQEFVHGATKPLAPLGGVQKST